MKATGLRLFFTIVFFGSTARAIAEPSVTIVPGEYEMSNNITDQTHTECFSEKELTANYIMRQLKDADDEAKCDLKDSRVQGNTLEVDTSCIYGDGMTGNGTMTIEVDGDNLNIKSAFTIDGKGAARTMEVLSVGKRIGSC